MSPAMKAVAMKCTRPSPDNEMYTPCHDLEKAYTFHCPDLLANTPEGRNFASCVAPGRNFRATFRKAPPAHAQLRPLRPEAEEWSRARAGGGSKGYAEIHTQGDARREASPSWGVCQHLAHFITTAFMAGLINPHTCNIPAFCIKCEDL